MTISSRPKYFCAFYKGINGTVPWYKEYELYILDCINRHDTKDHKGIGFFENKPTYKVIGLT